MRSRQGQQQLFLWISEQSAIVSRQSFRSLVFRTEAECVYSAVRTVSLNITFVFIRAVPWLRRLVASLLSRRSGFDPRAVQVRFVVDKGSLGHDFLRVLPFFPAIIIPPVMHTHLHLHVTLTSTKGQRVGKFQKQWPFGNRGATDKKCFHSFRF